MIPDAQSAGDYSSALPYYATAAQDCLGGAGNSNYKPDLIAKTIEELDKGAAKLGAAAQGIQAAIGPR